MVVEPWCQGLPREDNYDCRGHTCNPNPGKERDVDRAADEKEERAHDAETSGRPESAKRLVSPGATADLFLEHSKPTPVS